MRRRKECVSEGKRRTTFQIVSDVSSVGISVGCRMVCKLPAAEITHMIRKLSVVWQNAEYNKPKYVLKPGVGGRPTVDRVNAVERAR